MTGDMTSDMSMPPDEQEEDNNEIHSFELSHARIPRNDQTYHQDANKGGRVKRTSDKVVKLEKIKRSKAGAHLIKKSSTISVLSSQLKVSPPSQKTKPVYNRFISGSSISQDKGLI